ncbi:hypothetical protein PF008_g9287 [Phytophthora fragariae]|uniref:Uncharacterized protein n=1 Tax=Phytophthora fragariae TaxID=53985 RepID=A0A6G0RXQ5_9STRA|nr:hypothetical protein PF008_g9287 [Phytophthora fragariae]
MPRHTTLHYIEIFPQQPAATSSSRHRWQSVHRTHVGYAKPERVVADPADAVSSGYNTVFLPRCRLGDPSGHRSAVANGVNASDADFPIAVNTQEMIPPDMVMKRMMDLVGESLPPDAIKSRKLRTHKLSSGSFASPTRTSAIKKVLEGCREGFNGSRSRGIWQSDEEIVPESPQSDSVRPLQPDAEPEEPLGARVVDLT